MEDKDIQVLVFHRDKDDKNWISRLFNGKVAILHRADPTIPQPNVPYLCKVDEKEKYAIAWILGLHAYPRAIITPPPRRFVYLESPGDKPAIHTDLFSIFDSHDLEYLYIRYPKENCKEADMHDDWIYLQEVSEFDGLFQSHFKTNFATLAALRLAF